MLENVFLANPPLLDFHYIFKLFQLVIVANENDECLAFKFAAI